MAARKPKATKAVLPIIHILIGLGNSTFKINHTIAETKTIIAKLPHIIYLILSISTFKLKNPIYSKISFRHANSVGYTNQPYLYDLKKSAVI